MLFNIVTPLRCFANLSFTCKVAGPGAVTKVHDIFQMVGNRKLETSFNSVGKQLSATLKLLN